MSKIIPGGRIGRSSIVLAGLGAAFVLAAPASALAQGMLCPVSFNVTSATTLGALQITAGYASAAALGDIVECSVVPQGAEDVLYNTAANSTTIGYADTVGFTGPTTFASCVFQTVGEVGPVAGDFAIAIDDATDNDIPPNDVTPTIAAVVGACVPSGSCSYTPETGCKLPTVAEKSKMSFKNDADDTKDQGQFQWKSGAETLVTEFSDPTTAGETWSWCTYDNGVLVRGSDVVSGAVGWAASGTTGFQFKGLANGVAQIKVKAGEAGKASVQVKAKDKLGSFVSPTLPFTGPTVAQLVIDNGMTTTCFQSTAGVPSKNDAASFSAKGNP